MYRPGTNAYPSNPSTTSSKNESGIGSGNFANLAFIEEIGSGESNWRWPEIQVALREAGEYARAHGHRLTFHPDHFVKLASKDAAYAETSKRELEVHSLLFDEMGYTDASPFNKINIQVHLSCESLIKADDHSRHHSTEPSNIVFTKNTARRRVPHDAIQIVHRTAAPSRCL